MWADAKVGALWGSQESLKPAVLNEKPPGTGKVREKGERELQGGSQCSGRELIRRARGREWGTMMRVGDVKKMQTDGYLKTTPPSKPAADYTTIKLLAIFLEAIKTQLAARSSGRQLPKGMEEAVSVLGSLSEVFVPPSAFPALSNPATNIKHTKMEKDPPNGYEDLVKKLPDRPARKLVIAAVKGKHLLTLAQVADLIFTYGIMLEATDRAMKGLLDIIAKKGVMAEEDVEEYLIFITVQLKEGELNQPLYFVPQLVEWADIKAGEVKLKRKRPPSALLPPRPTWHALRVLGLLANTFAALLFDPKEADKEAKYMTALDKLLLRSLVAVDSIFLTGWGPKVLVATSSENLLLLCIHAKYLAIEKDPLVAAVGTKIVAKIVDSELWMEADELVEVCYALARPLFFSLSAYKLVLASLQELKLLPEEEATELALRSNQDERVNGVNLLGVLVEVSQRMELSGEELVARRLLTKDAIIGEPVPQAPWLSPLSYAWDSSLDLLYEYAIRARIPHLQPGPNRASYQKDLFEKAFRRLESLPLPGKDACLAYLREAKDVKKDCSKTKLTALITLMGPSVKLDRASLLPFLFFLKSQGLVSPAQFETIYRKSPYPLSVSLLKVILDKVYSWNTPVKTNLTTSAILKLAS